MIVCLLVDLISDQIILHYSQSVNIDPPTLLSYSADAQFKDLDKRIDSAFGLRVPHKDTRVLQRGVYEAEGTVDSINQTKSFVNFTPMFLNIEVKRKNEAVDPLIQLAAWISAEFEKRKIEHYSSNMPTLAIEIHADEWFLHIVYAAPTETDGDGNGDADAHGYRLNFVGPILLGDTISLAGCLKLLDGLCRCAEWGVGSYQSWFRQEVLAKYK